MTQRAQTHKIYEFGGNHTHPTRLNCYLRAHCSGAQTTKMDLNRVQITVVGNLIDYPFELTTRTADLTTSRVMWNSVISTPGENYACTDVKSFYLCTPLVCYKYMRMPIDLVLVGCAPEMTPKNIGPGPIIIVPYGSRGCNLDIHKVFF